MPRIGPAFLHRPLPAFSSVSLGAMPRWLLAGLSYFAPAPLRRTLWRPFYRLARDGEDGAVALVEEAWSGERRISSVDGSPEFPIAVALPGSRVFETAADLPAAAAESLGDAIALRLEALSPLPPEEIVFGAGAPEKTGDGRIRVPVAIARKADVGRIEERFAGKRLHSIGAGAGDDGSLRYVFKRFSGEASALSKAAIVGAALILGAMMFATGLALRLDKEIAAGEAYEAALMAELRRHKDITAWLPDAGITRSGVAGEDMAKALGGLANALPEGARLKRAVYTNGAWSLEGFAPETAAWPDQVSPAFTPSDRPGFQRFQVAVSPADTP